MPYLVDGHNLIPKLPGMSLKALDDESALIEKLQEFCRLRRKQAELYFDNAPPGSARVGHYGNVVAHFVRAGQTADQAIQARLTRLGAKAKNWVVVSSDQAVQAAARAARARYLSSEVFADEMMATLRGHEAEPGKRPDASLSAEEIEDWLTLFGGKAKP